MNGSVDLDRGARVLDGGRTVVGGDPPRALRFTDAGARALGALLAQDTAPPAEDTAPLAQDTAPPAEDTAPPAEDSDPARRALRTRLIDGGVAHPRPRRAPASVGDVTVVVPVRDRAAALDRCLAAVADTRVIVVDDGSRDAAGVVAVCARHGARLIRRERSGGPGVARNAALAHVSTELVAFLDSDCVPDAGWLELLAGTLADPRVAAAAPRVRPVDPDPDPGPGPGPAHRRAGPVARFAASRSPLDMGDAPTAVRPGGRISYVPTAALLVRRSALDGGFDPGLRHGEDVDLVWRIHDAGHRVRYEPAATVRHAEPRRWRELLARRYRYGTSAAPLARRHPSRLAPIVVHPRPVAVVALAAAGRPALAAGAAVAHVAATTVRLRRAGVPPRAGAGLAARGLADSAVAIGRAATMLAPALLAAGLVLRRTRPAALGLLLAEPVRGWSRVHPRLDPVRWAALAIADDVAYGAGVWAGAARARTTLPLRPARAR